MVPRSVHFQFFVLHGELSAGQVRIALLCAQSSPASHAFCESCGCSLCPAAGGCVPIVRVINPRAVSAFMKMGMRLVGRSAWFSDAFLPLAACWNIAKQSDQIHGACAAAVRSQISTSPVCRCPSSEN